MDNVYLYFYSLVWLLTFIFFYRKKKMMDCGNFVILLFFVYSVFSIVLYKTSSDYGSHPIHFFSLIYLYLMIMLTMSPVFAYNQQKIKQIVCPNEAILDGIVIMYIVASIFSLPEDFRQIRDSLVTMVTDSSAGLDAYHEAMADSVYSLGDGRISNIPSIIKNLFRNIVMVIAWYYVVTNKKKLYIYLSFSFIMVDMLLPLAKAQRGITIAILLIFIATYFSMIKFMPSKLKKRLTVIMVAAVILLSIPFMAITHSRFDRNEGGVQSSMVTYIGQENLNFAIYGFDNNGLRYGDRVCPFLKRMLGYDNVPRNFWERRAKYPHLRINDEVFIGYVGDFVLDFGPVVSFVLFVIFTIILYPVIRIRSGTLYFHQLIALSMLLYVGTIGGLKLFPFADNGALTLITYIIMYIVFYNGKSNRTIRLIENGK